MTSRSRARFREIAPLLGLALLTIAVYANTLRNGFVWDDQHIIVGNPSTRDLSQIGNVLLSPDEFGTYYRPLNRASYLIDYALFGMSPTGFHAVNLLLHVANVLLLYALGRRLFPSRAPAIVAAALLAVHPIQSEPVNFITARNNLLALLFSVAALVLFVDADRRGSRARAWLSGAAFFLGVLSKEPAFAVLPVLGAWLRLTPRPPGAARRYGQLLLPHALAVLAYLGLRTVSVGGGVGGSSIATGLLSRIAQNVYIVPRYLALAVYPRALTIFHSVPPRWPSVGWLPVAWAAILAAVALLSLRRALAASVGLLWLGFNLLPIANIVPIPSAPLAERYFYVPAAGLWLVAADLLWRLDRRLPRRGLVGGAVAILIAALGARTVARNRDWHDDLALFRSAVAVDPASVDARFNLGVALKDAGDVEGARREWEAALAVDPGSAQVLTQLGTLSATTGRLDEAERWYRRALASDPAIALAHYNLARICDRSGRPREALVHYQAFLELPAPEYEYAGFVAFARERVSALRAEAATPRR